MLFVKNTYQFLNERVWVIVKMTCEFVGNGRVMLRIVFLFPRKCRQRLAKADWLFGFHGNGKFVQRAGAAIPS